MFSNSDNVSQCLEINCLIATVVSWSSNLCWIAPSTDLCGNVGGAFVECSHSGRSLCSLCLRFHKPQVQRWCHFSMCDFSLRSPNLVAHSGYFSISKIVCVGWGGVCSCQKLQTLARRLIQHHNSMHTLLYQTTATSTYRHMLKPLYWTSTHEMGSHRTGVSE